MGKSSQPIQETQIRDTGFPKGYLPQHAQCGEQQEHPIGCQMMKPTPRHGPSQSRETPSSRGCAGGGGERLCGLLLGFAGYGIERGAAAGAVACAARRLSTSQSRGARAFARGRRGAVRADVRPGAHRFGRQAHGHRDAASVAVARALADSDEGAHGRAVGADWGWFEARALSALAHFADSSRTSREVREVPTLAMSRCSKPALIRSPRRR